MIFSPVAVKACLILLDKLRLEGRIPVTRNFNGSLSAFAFDRLRRGAVSGIAAVIAK
jgi:hypothetical protein